jgi:hypothetical protein
MGISSEVSVACAERHVVGASHFLEARTYNAPNITAEPGFANTERGLEAIFARRWSIVTEMELGGIERASRYNLRVCDIPCLSRARVAVLLLRVGQQGNLGTKDWVSSHISLSWALEQCNVAPLEDGKANRDVKIHHFLCPMVLSRSESFLKNIDQPCEGKQWIEISP